MSKPPVANAAVDVVCIASWNADLVVRLPRPAARGETLLASQFDILPGGKGSNAAVAAARQGARVGLVSRIGDDDFGRMGLELWQQEGICASHVVRAAGERSGIAQIWVYDDGDNSIAVAPGAGSGLAAQHVDAAAPVLRQARVVISSCEVPLSATQRAFEIARDSGVTTLLNPAPARRLPEELLALTDVLTPNGSELRALAGADATHDEDTAARMLLERWPGWLIVTLGDRGCRSYRRGEPVASMAAHPVSVADTIGAGDTFTGALAAALDRGEPPSTALRLANAAAALSVTRSGALAGMPTLAQVREFLLQT